MFNRFLVAVCFLLIQFLPIQEAHATTGYTSWNDYVAKLAGCQSDIVHCSGFAEGQTVYLIGYGECLDWSGYDCNAVKNYISFGNDPYGLLGEYAGYMNPFNERYSGNTITSSVVPNVLNENGLFFNVYYSNADGTKLAGNGLVSVYPVALCSGFIGGYGCPNGTTGNNPPGTIDVLDRTKIKDAPCETCSTFGNAFDVRNGSKTSNAIDVGFPISVQRIYSSKMKNSGMVGGNWRSNFDKQVNIIKNNNNTIVTLSFVTPDDQEIMYTSTDGTIFVPAYNDSSQYKLTISNNNIVLVRPDSGVENYDLITGKITSEVYKGKTLTYQYNSNGLLFMVTDTLGRYIQFDFNSASNLQQITMSNGDILQYGYIGGNVSTVSLNNITQMTYEYSGALLIGIKDAANIQTSAFTYDSQGRGLESKIMTNDGHDINKYTFSYNNPQQTVVTQANGFSRTYNLTTLNYQQKIQSLNWNDYSEQNSFDSNGNVTTKKDLNNVYEHYTYDTDGRIVAESKDGKQANITWDTVNNIINSISENSANGTRTTSYTYDSDLNVTQKTVVGTGDTMTWNYTWSLGRIASESAPDGLVTTYAYNPTNTTSTSGLLSSITTNSGQNMVINSYDVRGNPTSLTVNGVNKAMTYDYKGRVLSESTAGITNNYTYDVNGNMLTAQMASSYLLTMTYDSAGRLLTIQDNMGGNSVFTFDDYTNEVLNTSISQSNALVRARNKVIDTLGRTTQAWNATDRTKELTNYSSYIDKPNSTVDANGSSSSYGWDSRNNMTSYSGGGDASAQTYDIDSNQTSVNVNNQATTMSYDDFGRVVQLNNADTGSHTYAYSTPNRTVSHTDAKGIIHNSVSDLNGNPITITHSDGTNTQNESYSYNISGELIGFNDNSGSTAYTRNNLEQITSKTQNIGSKSFTVQYGYNSIGQKISETYPSGMVINYTYSNGFLNNVSASGTNIVSNVQYNSMLKEATSWTLGGNVVSMNKDTDGLLTGFVDTGIFNQTITTDNDGHVLTLSDNVGTDNFNVALSDNYGIKSGNINGNSLYYNYATNNNLYVQRDGITNYSFNPPYSDNKVTSFNNATNNYYYVQYDANGNTTSDNKGSYIYDLKNNLTSSTRTINSVSNTGDYTFNALGHRVTKTVSGQIRYFTYNENNQLIGEYDDTGTVINEYVYFGLRPVAVKNGSVINIVHTDYLSTPRVVTSGTATGGSMVWQWNNNNPYGNNEAQGTMEFNLRFAGQYYDSESGLHYNIHRTYNPEFGRYMQSDPIGLAGGFNSYNYANRNPLDGFDPLGLDPGLVFNFTSPTSTEYNQPIMDFNKYALTRPVPDNMILSLGHGVGDGEGNGAIVDLDSSAMQKLKNIDATLFSEVAHLSNCHNKLCGANSKLIDGRVLAYIIKKLINSNKEYDTLIMTQCWGTQISNIESVPKILQMNTWISNGLVFLGNVNNHTEPVGSLTKDTGAVGKILDNLKDHNISSEEATSQIIKDPYFLKGIDGFLKIR